MDRVEKIGARIAQALCAVLVLMGLTLVIGGVYETVTTAIDYVVLIPIGLVVAAMAGVVVYGIEQVFRGRL